MTGPTATTTAAYNEEEGSPPVPPLPRAGERWASIPCTSPCPGAERGLPGGLGRWIMLDGKIMWKMCIVSLMQMHE